NVAKGLSLRHACALHDPPFSAQHFTKSIGKHPALELLYDGIVGAWLRGELEKISDAEGKQWQSKAWILERAHGYSTKTAPQVSVNVQTLVGVDDSVARRAAQFVKRAGQPKQIEIEAPPSLSVTLPPGCQ